VAKAMLIDVTSCNGCRACTNACRERNRMEGPAGTRLSANDFTVLESREGRFVRKLCMHCVDPACATACPVGALVKTPDGPVVYNEDRCMGCRYCMVACPHGVPAFEWDSRVPRIRKCRFCDDLVAEGKPPACATACPTEATLFGERDRIIATAMARMESRPGRYLAGLYGRDEAGGTSILYLSDVPFEKLAFRVDLEPQPLGLATGRVLSLVPAIAGTVVTFLGGTYWLYRRREEVAAMEGRR
jgi:formate dehydrogenase iron-sulfur subunit